MTNDSVKQTDDTCCPDAQPNVNIKNEQSCCYESEDKGCCPTDEN
ncbi:hypothetical protein [Paenibacillus sp. FSL E2-0201]